VRGTAAVLNEYRVNFWCEIRKFSVDCGPPSSAQLQDQQQVEEQQEVARHGVLEEIASRIRGRFSDARSRVTS